ncbi:MAG: methyl-accepting chemotaxis protein [Huintestinicola sp.]
MKKIKFNLPAKNKNSAEKAGSDNTVKKVKAPSSETGGGKPFSKEKLSEVKGRMLGAFDRFAENGNKKRIMSGEKLNAVVEKVNGNPVMRSFAKMNIGRRLNIFFIGIMLIVVIAMSISLVFLKNMSRSNETFYNEAYQVVNYAKTVQLDFQMMQKDLFIAAFEIDMEEKLPIRLETLENDQKMLLADIQTAREHYSGDPADFDKLDELLAAMEEPHQYVVDTITSKLGRNQVMFKNYVANYEPLIEEAAELLQHITDVSNETAEKMNNNMSVLSGMAVVITICLIVFVFLMLFFISRILTLSIVPPILEVEKCAEEISKGNLSYKIAYHGSDEMGQLAESMRTTVDNLNAYISDISYCLEQISKGNLDIEPTAEFAGEFVAIDSSLRTIIHSLNATFAHMGKGANQVSDSSKNVANDAEALAQGSIEQSSSIESLIESIRSISVQIQNNAKSAKDADDTAELLVTDVAKGRKCMEMLADAMTEISASSEKIGNIISTIEDIAFQTNILALNAAVEAARAGDAGKGFAVVADEVRNLANMSAEAASDTNELIRKSIESVNSGMGIADETAKALNAIVSNVDSVAGAIKSISEVCEEQASEIDDVSKGINQISVVVQKNSQAAENSAAVSKTLSDQSDLLRELVHGFKLKE